ncbi:MAG: conditioned medium-induced protein 4 [Halobacteriaceae archaeon]
MDEKTEELRDIFMSVADEETVTDEQAETPGSLAPGDDIEGRLAEVVAGMRADREFSTTLDDDELVAVVRGFYAGRADADIADDIGVARETVVRARMDLHLLREDDLDAPFELAAFREAMADADDAALAERFGVSAAAAGRYRRALETREEILRVNDRYRDEFETALQDPELAGRFTAQESGLDEATADQEVDVSF